MNEWKKYRRTGLTEMRPFVSGENLAPTSCTEVDREEIHGPGPYGMVVRNPKDKTDQRQINMFPTWRAVIQCECFRTAGSSQSGQST